VRFLTPEEQERLLAASQPDFRQILVFLLDTGLRVSELADLTWDAVDLEHNVVTVYGSKTSRTARNYTPRKIPLTQRAAAVLAEREPRGERAFLNEDGEPYNRNSLRLRFDRVRKKAGVPDVSLHTLRHTFASRLSMSGENLQTVAALLGHTTTRTAEIYSHLAQEHLAQAVKRLERNYAIEPGKHGEGKERTAGPLQAAGRI
jgi:integrase